MSNYNSDIFLRPDSSDEREYCDKYGIVLSYLENGIITFGISCNKDATVFANIKFEFQRGAFGNPPGAVHFLEHFLNKKISSVASLNDVDFGAYTSQIEIGENIRGIANPAFKDYGVWPVLREVRNSLESPLGNADDIKKAINSEKEVVLTEIKERESDHNYHVSNHFLNFIYAKNNPNCNIPPVTGTEFDVERLDYETLKCVQDKVLLPSNLLISFYSEGPSEIKAEIINEIVKLFTNFPRSDVSTENFERKILESVNKGARPGVIHRLDHGIRNDVVTYEFVWLFKNKFLSSEFFAARFLQPLLGRKVYEASRANGWGYTTHVAFDFQHLGLHYLKLRVTARKNRSISVLKVKRMLEESRKEIPLYLKQEKKRQKASPVSVFGRFSWVETGIKEFGAIIDADKVRSKMLNLQKNDCYRILDEMIETGPITLITGDLA